MDDFGVIPEPGTVRFERLLPGPIERVWAYLTESGKRGTWLASGEMELRVGGRVALHFRHADLSPVKEPTPERYKQYEDVPVLYGRITRCDPPRLLSYTWGEDQERSSEVSFELSPRGDEVLLVLTHHRLGDAPATLISVGSGWHTHLGILTDCMQGLEPRTFRSTQARLEAEYEKRLQAT